MSMSTTQTLAPGAAPDAARLHDALPAIARVASDDPWTAAARIVEAGAAALGAASAGVWLGDPRVGEPRLAWPAAGTVVLPGGEADGSADDSPASRRGPAALDVPFAAGDDVAGWLRFERAATGGAGTNGSPWSDAERLFAAALAERIAAALERGARVVAERTLRESRRQVDEAEALAGLGSWEWDVPTNVIRWSAEQLRLHGLDEDAHPDTFEQFLAHVHEDDRALVVDECTRLVETKEPFSFHYRIVRSDGRTRWLLARGRMRTGSDGQASRMVGTSLDVTERREAEEALRASERRFRDVFDQFPISLQTFAPDGRLLRVNPAYERLWGFGARELGAYNPLEDPQLEAIRPLLRRGFAGEAVALPVVAYDGRVLGSASHGGAEWPRWLEAFLFPVRDEAGGIREVVVVHTDVTEQKLAEAALRSSEESYRTIFELAGDAIFVHDPETGAVLDANRKACELHGITLDELKALGIGGVSAGDAAEQAVMARDLVRRAAAGESQRFEWQGRNVPAGQPVWVEVTLERVGILDETRVLAVVRDVTERKLAQQALERAYGELECRVAERTGELAVANQALESEIGEHREVRERLQRQAEELEALFRGLPDVYLRIRRDGIVVDHRFGSDENLYPIPDGFPPILAGSRITEYMPPELGSLLGGGIGAVLESGQIATFEYPLEVRGEERHFETRVAPMPDDTVLCIIRDITARKRSEAALALAKEEADRARVAAEQANRAKSEFLSRMSHELRTPMNSILGFAQLLARAELTPQHSRSVQHILKAGRHLLQLINEVLEIARIEAGRQALSLEPVRVRTVLGEALALVRPLAAQFHVELEDASVAPDAFVRADRQRLAQVLLNLLSNAIKYNRPGGRVRLSVETTASGDDGRVVLRVEDTGRGIPAERVGQLFTPFSRLGAERTDVEGTGLGLALSERLSEAMGGSLVLERTGVEGSVFRLELARADSPLASLDEARTPEGDEPGEAPHAPATLLYVEDNLANLSLVETILLSRPRWRTIPALQGQLGLELAREHSPDLILLDLHLPDLPGEEVLKRLREDEKTARVPVVVISADATTATVERLKAAGVAAFLTKPLDVDEFLATLERLLPAP